MSEGLSQEDEDWMNAPMGNPDKLKNSTYCPTCNKPMSRPAQLKPLDEEAVNNVLWNGLMDFDYDAKGIYIGESGEELSEKHTKILAKAICAKFGAKPMVLPKKFDRDGLMPLQEGFADGWDECIDATIEFNKQAKALPTEEELADMIIKVAMAHHEDISASDDDNALECAKSILARLGGGKNG